MRHVAPLLAALFVSAGAWAPTTARADSPGARLAPSQPAGPRPSRPPGFGAEVAPPRLPVNTDHCMTEEGTLEDGDGDGVPRRRVVVYDCVDLPVGEQRVSVRGTVTIDDEDDRQPLSGFALRIQGLVVRVRAVTGGESVEHRIDREVVLHRLDGGATYALDEHAGEILALERDGRTVDRVSHRFERSVRYVPDARRAPFEAGTLTSRETLTITRDGVTHEQSRHTAPSAHYSAACQRAHPSLDGFDRGVITMSEEGILVARAVFAACGRARVHPAGSGD